MSVTVKMSGDPKDILAAMQEIQKGAQRVNNEYKRLSEETKQGARFAKRAWEDSLTPMQKYHRSVVNLKSAYRDNVISQEQFKAGVAKSREELERSKQELDMVEATLVQGGKSAKIFGKNLEDGVTRSMAAITALVASLQKVREIYDEIDRARTEAHAGLEGTQFGYAELGQLSTDRMEVARLRGKAAAEFRRGVGESLDEAGAFIFQLQSTGLMEDKDLFSEMARTRLITNLESTVRETAGLMSTMGRDEVGTSTELMSKISAVSGLSREGITTILRRATVAGSQAAEMGISDEELLSGVAVLTRGRQPEEAGTQMSALLDVMLKRGIEGATFTERLQKIREETTGMTGEEQLEYFGRKEARRGFQFLSSDENLALYRQGVQMAIQGQQEDRISRQLWNQRQDPFIQQMMRERAQTNEQRFAQMMQEGMLESEDRIGEMRQDMMLRGLGVGEVGRAAIRVGQGMLPRSFTGGLRNLGGDVGEGAADAVIEKLDGIRENTEKVFRPRVPAPEQ